MDSGDGFGQGAIDVRVVVGRMQVHVVLMVAFASKHLEGTFLKRPQLAGHLIVGAIKAREIQKVSVLIHLQFKSENKIRTETTYDQPHFHNVPSSIAPKTTPD